MKVICTSQCQSNLKTLYEVGKEYDITAEMYKNNKEFFKKVKIVEENKDEG